MSPRRPPRPRLGVRALTKEHGLGPLGQTQDRPDTGRTGVPCGLYLEVLIFFNWYKASRASRGLRLSGLMAPSADSTALAVMASTTGGAANRSTWARLCVAWVSSAASVCRACHLNTVALAGRAALDLVQKDNVAARLSGAHMHVDGAVVRGRKLGQLEVVGGEQGEGLGLVVQLRGYGRGQCQAVKGAGATANLIHQHQ